MSEVKLLFAKDKLITVFDIGSNSIKVLTGYLKSKSIVINDYEIIPTPQNAMDEGIVKDKNALVEVLSKVKVKSKDIRVVLSSSEIVQRVFHLPKLDVDEVYQAVKLEMEVFLPEKIENYLINAIIIEEYMSQKEDNLGIPMYMVQGIAIERKIVIDYLECFAKSGHKVRVVDILSNSLKKLFCSENKYIKTKGYESLAHENFAIIDLGHEKIGMTLIEDQNIFLHRTSNQGGKEITQAISEVLGMGIEKAEEWKKKNDFSFTTKKAKNDQESILATRVNSAFYNMTIELFQRIEFFISMSKNKKCECILLTGGNSLIPVLKDYIETYTGIHTETIESFDNIEFNDLHCQSDISMLVNSMGAFIRKG